MLRPDAAPSPVRYVFVGGLHRSGTTLLASCLEDHPEIRGLSHAPVPEGEGVYLQGAIPHTARHGVPGAFAEDPAQHHVEGGPHDRLEVRDRLRSDWEPWFAPGGRWRVEKSPVNLLRSRLYQQFFPASQFVFVVRHPVAVARATAKWSDRGEAALLRHWETAHRLMAGDTPHLHCWLLVRFEDLTERPEAELARVFAFLGLDPVAPRRRPEPGLNEPYLAAGPPAAEPGPMAAALGYGAGPLPGRPSTLRGAHPFRSVREAIA